MILEGGRPSALGRGDENRARDIGIMDIGALALLTTNYLGVLRRCVLA